MVFHSFFFRVQLRANKARHQEILLGLKDELPQLNTNSHETDPVKSDQYYFPVKGILFYKITKSKFIVIFLFTSVRF